MTVRQKEREKFGFINHPNIDQFKFMDKKEILKLINQQIKTALDEFKQELKQKVQVKRMLVGKENEKIKSISLQQFVEEKRPKKVASEEMPVLAYYLREIDKRKLGEVDEEIMKKAYEETDRSRPKRIKQAFIDSSYFDKATKEPGFYKMNDNGDYFIEVVLEKRKK